MDNKQAEGKIDQGMTKTVQIFDAMIEEGEFGKYFDHYVDTHPSSDDPHMIEIVTQLFENRLSLILASRRLEPFFQALVKELETSE